MAIIDRTFNVMIEKIFIPNIRDWPVDDQKVQDLIESISQSGLINSIVVKKYLTKEGTAIPGSFELVAGRHRLEALTRMDHVMVRAIEATGDEDEIRLVEIDENLIRRELGAALMSKLIAERSKLLVKRSSAQNGPKSKGRKTTTGTTQVAKLTGKSKTEVQRLEKRGSKIEGEVLAAVAGSSVDKPGALDVLVNATAEEKATVVEAVKKERAAKVVAKKKPVPSMGGPRGVGTGEKAAEALARPMKSHDETVKRIVKVVPLKDAAEAIQKIRARQKAEAHPKIKNPVPDAAKHWDQIASSVLHRIEHADDEETRQQLRELAFERLTVLLGRIWPQVPRLESTKKASTKKGKAK